MTKTSGVDCANARNAVVLALLVISQAAAWATDWPQYRGPANDGTSPDRMLAVWPGSPTVVWRNPSATNGFSSPVVSQGRVFAMSLKSDGADGFNEHCVAINAANGATLWTTMIDIAPVNWDPQANVYGGDGSSPYNTGDGPRTTPSAQDGRVFAFSGSLRLVCLNATNGSILWNNDLQASYGGVPPTQYENGASPCLDNDLLFVNLSTATNDETLIAFNVSDGEKVWSSQNERSTHSTPIVTTIQGVRQVIFATTTGLVSLDRNTGTFLWKYTYPFSAISVAMGASPLFYSNIVYCTTAYGRGAAAARVVFTNSAWNVSQLYYKHEVAGLSTYHYSSIWMSPVCYQGYVYSLAGQNNGTFLTAPLNCIELSTGVNTWSANNFGMGGLILVDTNLVAITETGQLVLIRPNPSAYTEVSRFQAFQFSSGAHGKCWNSPTFSDGHLYVRSTREIINVDVSVPPSLPGLTTGGTSNLTATSATLFGTANPNGATTGAWFQWGLTTSYGSNTPAALNLGGTAPLNISNSLSGLIPGTTYHFRIAGTNSAGATNGADATFATFQSILPDLTTSGASNVTTTAAKLYGKVNPNGSTTGAWFQWGLTTNYGSNTPIIPNLSGTTAMIISNSLSGLAHATTYHFRITATNGSGTTNGADSIFATSQTAPLIITQPRSRAGVAGGSASFNVSATSPPTNNYEWRLYVTNVLAGQTNATLSIANLQPSDFGDYTVQVSNSFGAVTSTVASLTRAVSPSISSNRINLNTLFLTFTTEYGPVYFVDYKNNLRTQAWAPLTSVAGTGSPITITDNGITNATRFYRIRLQ